MNYLQELWAALDFGSLRNILLRLASVFLCLTTHETCHGLAAYALGDPTAKRMHRLSLNPLRHIDWMGLLMMVTLGFGGVDILSSMDVLLVMFAYTFQLYFDFSGYCDMAVGISCMLNIHLPINFNSPYKALREKDPLRLLDSWSLDLSFDGTVHRPSQKFLRDKKGQMETTLTIPVDAVTGGQHAAISIAATDVFGNRYRRILRSDEGEL